MRWQQLLLVLPLALPCLSLCFSAAFPCRSTVDGVMLKDRWLALCCMAFLLSAAHVEENDYLEKKAKQWEGDTKVLVARGWSYQVRHCLSVVLPLSFYLRQCLSVSSVRAYSYQFAEAFTVLKSVSNAMGRALRERDPCYAAATYALCEALFAQRTNQVNRKQAYGGGGGGGVRQRSSLLKAVITAFPCVSLPFLAVPLLSQPTVAIRGRTTWSRPRSTRRGRASTRCRPRSRSGPN
eukprot:SAG22_NODE_404_length_11005_cov_8.751788_17_plen_237_part_00